MNSELDDIDLTESEVESEVESEFEDPTEQLPTAQIRLTNGKRDYLKTLKLEYIDDLPEYPTTHLYGYTYVVAARGRSQEEMQQLVQEVLN
ncbi:hypothetical protein EYZ11_013213 [Aspergillus tanneri]|uniref:Uncharacterized protein n=1 Tax=Aspergillus tanneri TaxID=1220188 RepID=A0A4S3IY80_9EURO|nr:hypothetical protein EYZ11_013213 [Aspergillus tanneri]